MPNWFLALVAFAALCVTLIWGAVSPAWGEAVCKQGFPFAEVAGWMKDKHGEFPAMIAPVGIDPAKSFLVFANPTTFTWTMFILHANGCAVEIRYLNGADWPYPVKDPGAAR